MCSPLRLTRYAKTFNFNQQRSKLSQEDLKDQDVETLDAAGTAINTVHAKEKTTDVKTKS